MQILERSKSGKIEDRAKVHVEPLCPLPGENSSAVRKFVNGLSHKCLIVGCRSGADVAGRTGQRIGCQDGRVPIIINSGHSIELWPVPIRATDRCDLTGIVQKTVGIDGIRLEPKLVRELMFHISAIDDVNLIQNIFAKFIEVWSTGWLF